MIWTVLVSGLAIGALYSATALAYNVMYSTSRVLSVATGHLCMLGGVSGAWGMQKLGLPAPLALVGAILCGALTGLLMEIIAVRRVLNRSDEHLWLLSTLALATIIQQTVALSWGTEPRPFPRLIPQEFGAGLADQKYWLPILALVVIALSLEVFYRTTMYGKIFMAVSEDSFAARARGIPINRVRAASYILAGVLAGFAGFAAGQLTYAYFALGHILTLMGFVAVAVGGLGSNIGAIIGGLLLGTLNALVSYYFGGEYQNTMSIGLLIVILILKPEGLFGILKVRQV